MFRCLCEYRMRFYNIMLFAVLFSIAQKVKWVNQTDFNQSKSLSYWSYQAMQTSDRMVNKSQRRESKTTSIGMLLMLPTSQQNTSEGDNSYEHKAHNILSRDEFMICVTVEVLYWQNLEFPWKHLWFCILIERQGKLVANQTISLPRGVGPTTLLQQILLNS